MTHRLVVMAIFGAAISSGALAAEHWVVVVDVAPALSSSRAAVSSEVISEVKSRPERWTDATELAAGVRGFRGLTASDFKRSPPRGWPDSLQEAWTQGASACEERMGDLAGGARHRTAQRPR